MDANICIKDTKGIETCYDPAEIAKLGLETKKASDKSIVNIVVVGIPTTFFIALIVVGVLGFVAYDDPALAIKFLGFGILTYAIYLLFIPFGSIAVWWSNDIYSALLNYTGLLETTLSFVCFYVFVVLGLICHIIAIAFLISRSFRMAKKLHKRELAIDKLTGASL